MPRAYHASTWVLVLSATTLAGCIAAPPGGDAQDARSAEDAARSGTGETPPSEPLFPGLPSRPGGKDPTESDAKDGAATTPTQDGGTMKSPRATPPPSSTEGDDPPLPDGAGSSDDGALDESTDTLDEILDGLMPGLHWLLSEPAQDDPVDDPAPTQETCSTTIVLGKAVTICA